MNRGSLHARRFRRIYIVLNTDELKMALRVRNVSGECQKRALDRKSTLFCCRGCKQIVFNVTVENNQIYLLGRLTSLKQLCYLKLMQSFFDGIGRRGVHVIGVGMFFVVAFRIINCNFLSALINRPVISGIIEPFWGL